MEQSEQAELLHAVRKYARFLTLGRITGEEFANSLLDRMAASTMAPIDLAAEVVAETARAAREALAGAVERVLRPDFRKGSWHYGGPDRRTDAEKAAESDMLTSRLKAWAVALAEHLDGGTRP